VESNLKKSLTIEQLSSIRSKHEVEI